MAGVLALSAPAFFVDVHAAKNVRTAPSGSKTASSFSRFIKTLRANGTNNYIRANVAPHLSLEPSAPSKAYVLDEVPAPSAQKSGKACSLVLSQDKTSPMCAVFLTLTIQKETATSRYFKTSLDGKLMSAIQVNSRVDENGKPVRGSGVKSDLDVTSPDIQKAFKKELDFWLSGKYRKYLKAKAEVKTAQN